MVPRMPRRSSVSRSAVLSSSTDMGPCSCCSQPMGPCASAREGVQVSGYLSPEILRLPLHFSSVTTLPYCEGVKPCGPTKAIGAEIARTLSRTGATCAHSAFSGPFSLQSICGPLPA